jgi:hypothetical protein
MIVARRTKVVWEAILSIKDWDMLTKINFVKNKYLWIPKICNLT